MANKEDDSEKELLVERTDAHFVPHGCIVREYISTWQPPRELVTSVFGFVFCGNQVLLTKGEEDHNHEWEIPGGHVELGESEEDTLRRELFEETGIVPSTYKRIGYIEITVPTEVGAYAYPRPINYMLMYVGVVDHMETPNDMGKWFSLDEARKNSWIVYHRALFEAMYQESHHLSGRYQPTRLALCDERGNLTGASESYHRVHRQGLWHKGVHVWLMNSKEEFLIQRRSAFTQTMPGKLECTAAGHVDAGTTSLDTAVRELHEEVGIQADPKEFELAATIVDCFEMYGGTLKSNEFDDVYVIRKDVDITTLPTTNGEISDLLWLPAREYLERGIAGDPDIVPRKKEYELIKKYLG